MKIGIITVLFKSDSVIDAFVECMNAQSFRDFYIFIVENDVNNEYCEKAISAKAKFQYTFVRNKANVGVAAGNNQGLDFFLPDHSLTHVLFLNNDIEVGADFLQKQVDIVREHGEADALAPKMFYHGTGGKIWYAGGTLSYLKGGGRHYGHNKPDRLNNKELYQVTYSPTCSLLVRADLLRKAGIRMWEELFVYEDDYVFCRELRDAGIRLFYTPLVHLQHKISASTGGAQSDFSRYYLVRNWFYVGVINRNIAVYLRAIMRGIGWMLFGRKIELKALRDGWMLARQRWAAVR